MGFSSSDCVIHNLNLNETSGMCPLCYKAWPQEIARLRLALEEIAYTPIEQAQYSIKDAQWTAREALTPTQKVDGE